MLLQLNTGLLGDYGTVPERLRPRPRGMLRLLELKLLGEIEVSIILCPKSLATFGVCLLLAL